MSKKTTPNESIITYLAEEKSRAKGFVFGSSVVLLGVFLIVFLFFWSSNGHLVVEETNFQPVKVNYDSRKNIQRAYGKMKTDWVKYSGSFQPFNQIKFKLRSFDPMATYVFDFGDGVQKNCKDGAVNHFYNRAGRYNVRVTVLYDNQEAVAWSKTISIKSTKGFNIDPSAYREY